MSSVPKELNPDLRYAVESIALLDRITGRLYDIWLERAIARAEGEGRVRVILQDAESTLEEAFTQIMEDHRAGAEDAKRPA